MTTPTKNRIKLDYAGTPYDISSFVKHVDVWGRGIGTFKLLLKKDATLDLTKFFGDQTIHIEVSVDGGVNYATLLKGYLDSGLTAAESTADAHHLEGYEVKGRNVAQDFNNKQFTKVYKKQPADDIVEDMLTNSGAEITFTSPSTAPEIAFTVKDKYLVQSIAEILEQIGYDGRVDDSKVWDMWQSGTKNSGGNTITLKSVAGETDNNIISLKKGNFEASHIWNKIKMIGPRVKDGWSEENCLTDWTTSANNVLTDEYVKIKGGLGIASLRCRSNQEGSTPYLQLDFPKFNYDYLDWQQYGSDSAVFWVYLYSSELSEQVLFFRLKDTNGDWIQYKTEKIPNNTWVRVSVPIGINCNIGSGIPPEGEWAFLDPSDTFNWQIKSIRIGMITDALNDWIIVDGLMLPDEMIAIAEDSGSQTDYKRRDKTVRKFDVETQVQLDKACEEYLARTKNPVEFLEIIARGDAGIKNGVNYWLEWYIVYINAPADGITSETYRFVDLHFEISETPLRDGFDFLVEVKVIKQSVPWSLEVWSLLISPYLGVVWGLESSLLSIERGGEIPTDFVYSGPATQIVTVASEHLTACVIASTHETVAVIATAHVTVTVVATAHSTSCSLTSAHSTTTVVATAHSTITSISSPHGTVTVVATAHGIQTVIQTSHSTSGAIASGSIGSTQIANTGMSGDNVVSDSWELLRNFTINMSGYSEPLVIQVEIDRQSDWADMYFRLYEAATIRHTWQEYCGSEHPNIRKLIIVPTYFGSATVIALYGRTHGGQSVTIKACLKARAYNLHTHGFSTQPSGHPVSTQPSSHSVQTQPSGHSISTQPSGHPVDTQPSGHGVAVQPSGHPVDTQPSGHTVSTQPSDHTVTVQPSGHTVTNPSHRHMP